MPTRRLGVRSGAWPEPRRGEQAGILPSCALSSAAGFCASQGAVGRPAAPVLVPTLPARDALVGQKPLHCGQSLGVSEPEGAVWASEATPGALVSHPTPGLPPSLTLAQDSVPSGIGAQHCCPFN